jgi:chromate transporter
VIAIIVQVLSSLTPEAIKRSVRLGLLGAVACVASALGADLRVVLIGAGLASVLARRSESHGASAPTWLPTLGVAATGGLSCAVPVSLAMLFLAFLKIGAIVFGSGYVLLALA